MAYINGEWLERPEREERIRVVTERVKKLRDFVSLGKASEYHKELLREDIAHLKKLKRIHRAEVDMLYFFYEYLSEARNPKNSGNLVPTPDVDMDDAPPFHKELSGILDSVSNYNKTAKICWSASRGSAKSAYLSNAHPLREIVYRKRKMIVIISETQEGSKKFLRWIADQLRGGIGNKKLCEDFGILLHENQKMNKLDNQEQFLTTSGTMLASSSVGRQIRGYRNGEQRPDLVILDDLESRANNNTAKMRQENRDWLTQDLEPALDVSTGCLIFMGTMVHVDSLLSYVLRERFDFIRNKFPAILNPPKREDLWQRFENIYKKYDPSDKELEEYANATTKMPTPNERAALSFFEANKEEMLIGQDPTRNNGQVEVLWEQRFPIEKLWIIKLSVGSKAWGTEYMNNPIDTENAIFQVGSYPRHSFDPNYFIKSPDYDVYFGVDWSLGKEKGDRSVCVALAKHKSSSKLYLVEYFAERMKPNLFMDKICDLSLKYQPVLIGTETNMAQEYMSDELRSRLQSRGYPGYTRVKGVHQKQKKELRIELLQPLLEKNTLLLPNGIELLEEEMMAFPNGKHDDILDALSLSVKMSEQTKATFRPTPEWL